MKTDTHTHPVRSTAQARAGGDVGPNRRIARIAGASYLLMFALAILANFLVLEGLVVEGDPASTTANIAESPGLMSIGIAAFVVIVLLDVTLSWALYRIFRPVDRRMAAVMGWFRLGYSVILGVSLVFLVQALNLATAAATSGSSQADETMQAVEAFQTTWLLGLVLFGVHLMLLGVLVARSRVVPRALGYVLGFAGVAYVADTVAHLALADYSSVAGVMLMVVALPSMFGEGWLGFWLLLTRRLP